jgi:hypothetical protein
MISRMRYVFNIIALITLVSFSATAQKPEQTIPGFQFFRLNNTPFTDKDIPQGKIIFFMFFDPDCDHCQHAIKTIGEQYDAFKKTAMFLISISDQQKIDYFMNNFGARLKGKKNITILQDKLQQFILKFHPVKYPSMFLYSPQRKLLDYEDNPESVSRLVNIIEKSVK